MLPSLYVLPSLYMLSSLCAFFIYFISMLPSERGGERGKERESKNKSTYLLCFLKEEEGRRERENKQTYLLCFFKKEGEREREREALASLLQASLK
jgi:hypothetical protein